MLIKKYYRYFWQPYWCICAKKSQYEILSYGALEFFLKNKILYGYFFYVQKLQLSEDGSWQTVKQVRLTNESLSAYNLTVDHNHTYFVTANAGQYGVWVHNDCDINNVENLWASGSPNGTALQNLQKHFDKHGQELGAINIEQYMRQAEGFKQNLRGATKSKVNGYNENVTRYKKNGKYIDLTDDNRIVSFGKQ